MVYAFTILPIKYEYNGADSLQCGRKIRVFELQIEFENWECAKISLCQKVPSPESAKICLRQNFSFYSSSNLNQNYEDFCKTLIIHRTLFSRGHHQWFIHETLFSQYDVFFYNLYIRHNWRGLYFCVSTHSGIYTKIKSSRITRGLRGHFSHLSIISPSVFS